MRLYKMKKILKEFFSFKTTKGELIKPNEFISALSTIGKDINGENIDPNTIDDSLVKSTNLSKEQIAQSLNNLVVAYMKEKGYDYFSKQLQSNNFDTFLNNMILDIQKFIGTLPESTGDKEFDSYGRKMGWDDKTIDKMSEWFSKLYNKQNLNDDEAREFIRLLTRRKTQVDLTPQQQQQFLEVLGQLHRMPSGQMNLSQFEAQLNNILNATKKN